MKKLMFRATTLLVLVAGCAQHPPGPPFVEAPNPYNQPLTSPGAKFAQLPPAVQNTIRAETGGAEIYDIAKETSSGRAVYMVYFENAELYPPLFLARDGSVLNPDLTVARGAAQDQAGIATGGAATGLAFRDLPPEVMDTVIGVEPDAQLDTISKEVWGNQTIYVISFKDEAHHPELYVASDGTVLKGPPER